jgi:hypothetical protein
MKQLNLFSILCAGLVAMFVSSCQNENVSFPDFAYSTVYFAYQTPVRTIVLGDDTYDTSLDNTHKCEIYATMGGVYANKKSISIDFVVDNTLCDYLNFADATPVKAMPSTYYSLSSNKILLDNVMQGAVGVQLTDAFFADAKSLTNTYVIPLKMTNVTNADSILSGKAKSSTSALSNSAAWDLLPKNYVLYCVKFINPWHGNYLRRGIDVVSTSVTPIIRHKQYPEYDDVVSTKTASLSTLNYPVSLKDAGGSNNVTCNLVLTFDAQGKCTITTSTAGLTATGTGSFVKNGEKNSWGNKDRNALYLSYNITMTGKTYTTTDTLVARDRGVAIETFTPVYTK